MVAQHGYGGLQTSAAIATVNEDDPEGAQTEPDDAHDEIDRRVAEGEVSTERDDAE